MNLNILKIIQLIFAIVEDTHIRTNPAFGIANNLLNEMLTPPVHPTTDRGA